MGAAVGIDDTEAGSLGAAIYSDDSHEGGRAGLGQGFHFRLIHFVIAVNVLHVVVLFECVVKLKHGLGALAFELDSALGDHGDLGGFGGNAGLLEGLQNGLVSVRVGRRKNFPGTALVTDVVGTGVEHDAHELVFTGLAGVDYDLAFAFKHPGNAALLTEIAAVLGEYVAYFAHGAVAVVGGDIDQHGCAARAVAFKENFVDLAAFELAGAAHNGALDVVGGHALGFGGNDCGAEAGVHIGIAAVAGGNH